MLKHKIPSKGEIYTHKNSTKKLRLPLRNYKPSPLIKTGGIVVATTVILLGVGMLFVPTKESLKQVAPTVSAINAANTTADGCRWVNTTAQGNRNGCEPVYIQPIQPIAYPTPTPYSMPQPGGQDGSGISGQIISIQQQINNQMQSCINYARQEANQIIDMKNYAQQLQNQIDSLNNQINNIDTSTPAGQARHDQLTAQVQQIQNHMDSVNTGINNARDQYSQTNDTCNQRVNDLKQSREDAEGKLDDAFNQAMDIQIPY